MPLGILEDRKLEHVPGTVHVLHDETRAAEHVAIDPNLKYDRSGPIPIVLVPQPSDDPNDPLNWPLWRRDLILFLLSLMAVIASSLSPILAAITLNLSLFFSRTFTAVALLTGWHLFGVGVAGFLFVPSSRVWGKRHAFLIGNVFLIFSCAWAGAVGKSYKSLLWARIFQGVGLAPFESLVNAVVGDLFFVHERGKRMALTNFCVFGGAFLTPVIVGKLSDSLGWPWTFNFVAIFSAAMLPVVFFFCPETAYRRSSRLNTDMGSNSSGSGTYLTLTGPATNATEGPAERSSGSVGERDPSRDMEKPLDVAGNNQEIPAKVSYWKTLLPFNGRKTNESYWKLLIRPFPLFFQPAILWACLIQGALIGWTVFLGIVLAAIMLRPPLFFNEVQTGYMYAGAFIGAVIGFVLSGLLSDSTAKWLTRKNGGIYEPEFRLPLVIPQLILGCAGLYGFGITSSDTAKYQWFWPDFFFCLEVAAMVIGAVASATYIVDAHRNISIEAFTCMMVFKNIFSYGLTWSAYDWLVQSNIKTPFIVLGSVQAGVCLLTIPMYIFGKRNRSFFTRYDILKMLHLS